MFTSQRQTTEMKYDIYGENPFDIHQYYFLLIVVRRLVYLFACLAADLEAFNSFYYCSFMLNLSYHRVHVCVWVCIARPQIVISSTPAWFSLAFPCSQYFLQINRFIAHFIALNSQNNRRRIVWHLTLLVIHDDDSVAMNHFEYAIRITFGGNFVALRNKSKQSMSCTLYSCMHSRLKF